MKKSLCFLGVIFVSLLSLNVKAQNPIFTHVGVQKGAMLEGCYHNPCSIGKVIQFKQLAKTNNSSMVELTLLGGSRDWNRKKLNGIKNRIKFMLLALLKIQH